MFTDATAVLIKLPLLLIEAYCAHVSAKPPTPQPSKHESAHYSSNKKTRDLVPWSHVKAPMLFRYTFYSIVVLEIVAISLTMLSPSKKITRIFEPDVFLEARALRPTIMYMLGLLGMCTGATIRGTCFRHMGRFYTFEMSVKEGHQLVTSGPYSVVRHPGYLGSCLFYSGTCFSQMGSGSFLAESGLWRSYVGLALGSAYVGYCIFICIFLVSRAPKEDVMMKKQFPKEWTEYAKRTPYRLVPYVY